MGSESQEEGEAGGGAWKDRASLCQSRQGESSARTTAPSPAQRVWKWIKIIVSGRWVSFHEWIFFILKPKPMSLAQQAKLPLPPSRTAKTSNVLGATCYTSRRATGDIQSERQSLSSPFWTPCSAVTSLPQELKCMHVHAKSLQSCPTLCDPLDCNPLGSSVYGILQARILEWIAMPFPSPGDLPDPGVEPTPLMSPALAGRFFGLLWWLRR